MKVMSLARLAEEIAYASQEKRNLSGSVEHAGKFKENFAALDSSHRGVYAFLAFHPSADRQVTEYLLEGTLGDDAGPTILALFMSPSWIGMPRAPKATDIDYGVKLTTQQHPAYELARNFYPSEAAPRFPGLIFFDSLSCPEKAIYTVLEGNDAAAIRLHCRDAFAAANKSFASMSEMPTEARRKFDFDRLAANLTAIPMQYQRSDGLTVRAFALISGVWLQKNAKALIMALPKIVEWGIKLKTGSASSDGS